MSAQKVTGPHNVGDFRFYYRLLVGIFGPHNVI